MGLWPRDIASGGSFRGVYVVRAEICTAAVACLRQVNAAISALDLVNDLPSNTLFTDLLSNGTLTNPLWRRL